MIPAAFEYKRASSADEAISLISQYGDEAKFLAGGHSLIPLMKLRLAQPTMLVDIGHVKDLSYIKDAGDHIAIGALTRHMDVEKSPVLRQREGIQIVPLFTERLLLAVPMDHRLAAAERVDLAQLKEEAFISMPVFLASFPLQYTPTMDPPNTGLQRAWLMSSLNAASMALMPSEYFRPALTLKL